MPKTPEWFTEGWPHIWLPYAQMQTVVPPLPVISAEGCRIKLADGRELVDGIASWWSMCHGYQHPHIVKAITEQAQTLSHVMFAGLAHQPAYTLAKRLCDIVGMGMEHVFFSESGSVAVEVALKMAIQYWRNKGESKRSKFVYFEHGYHGDTLGAMSVSARSHFNAAYDNITQRNYTLPIPQDEYDFAEFTDTIAAIRGSVAAVIIEPLVQAAGGFRFHSADILSEIRRVCREHDILLIVDEIATGFARTGTLFACHEAAIEPDILCLGKALTGGHMPLAATLTNGRVFDAFLSDDEGRALMHGPTFMAHPIACAAANASLDLFEREPRVAQAEALELALWEGLRLFKNHEAVHDVRVKGAIGVIEFTPDFLTPERLRSMRATSIEHGAWLRPFDNVLYLMPPLTLKKEELHVLHKAISHCLY
jgi:adenosylmethionine-8-amino-7-oxononanoate aminotransferase